MSPLPHRAKLLLPFDLVLDHSLFWTQTRMSGYPSSVCEEEGVILLPLPLPPFVFILSTIRLTYLQQLYTPIAVRLVVVRLPSRVLAQ